MSFPLSGPGPRLMATLVTQGARLLKGFVAPSRGRPKRQRRRPRRCTQGARPSPVAPVRGARSASRANSSASVHYEAGRRCGRPRPRPPPTLARRATSSTTVFFMPQSTPGLLLFSHPLLIIGSPCRPTCGPGVAARSASRDGDGEGAPRQRGAVGAARRSDAAPAGARRPAQTRQPWPRNNVAPSAPPCDSLAAGAGRIGLARNSLITPGRRRSPGGSLEPC